MKKENDIDQLFKKGLEEPEIPFNELDWKKMAARLDASKTSKDRSLWYAMAGIAAAILLVFSFFLLSYDNQTVNKKQPNHQAKSKADEKKGQSSQGTNSAGAQKEKRTTASSVGSGRPKEPSTGTQVGNQDARRLAASKTPVLEKATPLNLSIFGYENQKRPTLALSIPKVNITTTLPKNPTVEQERAAIDKAAIDKMNGSAGKLTLSILGAPDITNTSSSIGTKVSSNFGLLLTYSISKKLSISSGAIYARKLYDYGGLTASAYGNISTPMEVDADCYVIDVPLNLNYQVLQSKKFSISVNTGLSSYFMLKEKYKYMNVNAAGEQETSLYEIKNQNKHLLGVANISVSLDHQINDRVSIGVQPFYKLPLTGIGLYDMNLKSKGVAVSISLKPFGSKR
jgi:hypothetical protein